MKRGVVIALSMLAGVSSMGAAHADDARRELFADSAAVVAVRPVALGGALRRLGSGWEAIVRRSVPLPAAVNPFDPLVLSLTGIDPSGVSWLGVRALRGGMHVRGVLPLLEARVADALVQTAGAAAGIELSASADHSWTGRLKDGMPLVVRVDGSSLIVDVVLAGPTSVPTPADVARVVPLHPPRAWAGTRGAQKRMSPSDAASFWADLDAVAKLGLQRSEVQMTASLRGVDAAHRAEISRQGQKDLAQCKSALNAVPHTFDDVFGALAVVGPDQLRIELASSGKRAGLDALRTLRGMVTPTRSLGSDGATDLKLALVAPPIPRAAAGPKKPLAQTCTLATTAAELAWGWPTLWATTELPAWTRILGGVRGALLTAPAVEGDDVGMGVRQLVGLAELDPSMRGDLDRLLADRSFFASTPLRVGARTLSTYATPTDALVLALDPSAEDGRGTVLGLGTRELLRAALEHAGARAGDVDAPLATLDMNGRGLRRLARELQLGRHEKTLFEGVTDLQGRAVLEAELLRGDADLQLAPRR